MNPKSFGKLDCSFGVFGLIPLALVWRMIRGLAAEERES